jgi:simple sugar transport system permease protein
MSEVRDDDRAEAVRREITDERLKQVSFGRRLLQRPELGAVAGVILVTIFFVTTANPAMFTLAGVFNFMTPASHLGILALGAALLMIGGEFDLSIGSMVAFAGLVFGVCLVNFGLPLGAAILITFAMACVFGIINGQIVIRTGLPSFIVTLAFLFILRGLALVGLKAATGGSTQLRGIDDAAGEGFLRSLFSGDALTGLFSWMAENGLVAKFPTGVPVVRGIPVSIIWFMVLAVLATWILLKTRFGNWIFASGGDANAARNSGVPVTRVKTILFMTTASAGSLVAILTVLEAGSTDALRGFMKEFEAIIAAVIGGCLLTGGYGSAIGAFFGAVIFGMVSIGLTYTDIDQDWYQVFLGGMLLIAVIFNNIIRRQVTGER